MTVKPTGELIHLTVLLDEAIEALEIQDERANGTYVDGTFGRGGHSRKLLQQLGPKGRLIAFDKDPYAIANAEQIQDPRFQIMHDSFANMAACLQQAGVERVDGILMDLGISSPQVDDAERGFSFRHDGPLDMRMDTTRGISAAEWLAQEDEQKIREVIENYGEE